MVLGLDSFEAAISFRHRPGNMFVWLDAAEPLFVLAAPCEHSWLLSIRRQHNNNAASTSLIYSSIVIILVSRSLLPIPLDLGAFFLAG